MDSGTPSRNLGGIFSMLAAIATFSMMDVAMKHLVETYPAVQVTFLRAASSLPFLLGAMAFFGRWRDLIAHRWMLHLVRGLINVAMLWLFVYSVKLLSLADAYSIFMSAPLLITALSVPLLGEQVGWRRWIAVLVGLIGVLVMLKPAGTAWISLGGLAAFAAAVGYALNAITIRILSRSDTGAATVIWSLVIVMVVSGAFSIPAWLPLRMQDVWWIVGLGLTGALGQHFMTVAFRRTAPSILAPLEYTALAWGMLFDWLLWLTAPSMRMLGGATIIVASGLYVIQRERSRSAVEG